MDFMTAVNTCFGKYVDFSGRAPRSEMWFFFLFTWIVATVAIIIDMVLIGTTALYYVVVLGTVLPSLAVHVRRLHDIGKSGWFWFIYVIPLIGWPIMFLVWNCTRGTAGPNQFGPDPLAGQA